MADIVSNKKSSIKKMVKDEIQYMEQGVVFCDTWKDYPESERIFESFKQYKEQKVAPADVWKKLTESMDNQEEAVQYRMWRKPTTAVALAFLAEDTKFIQLVEEIGLNPKHLYRNVAYNLRGLYSSRKLDEYEPRLILKLMSNVQEVLEMLPKKK